MEYIVIVDCDFCKPIKCCLNYAWPLMKVLQIVDGDLKPAMSYVYRTIDMAKEQAREEV